MKNLKNESIFTFTVEFPAIAQPCASSFFYRSPHNEELPSPPPRPPSAGNVTAQGLQLLWFQKTLDQTLPRLPLRTPYPIFSVHTNSNPSRLF